MPPIIETERLLIRPFTQNDIDAAYTVLEGHPDVWKFDPGYQRTHEQRAALITKYATNNEHDGCGTVAVTLKANGALIGYVGLQLYVLPREPLATPEVELYYKLGRAYWGQSYAAEACRAIIRFAFDEMRLAQIVTITASENVPSIKLLETLGMQIAPAPPSWAGSVTGTLQNDRS